MRTYTISPSIDGIISDDCLFFEGIKKPLEIFAIRDGLPISSNDIAVLEKYFNDISNLFLKKFSAFASFESFSDEEIVKVQALLQELIKVRKMIESR